MVQSSVYAVFVNTHGRDKHGVTEPLVRRACHAIDTWVSQHVKKDESKPTVAICFDGDGVDKDSNGQWPLPSSLAVRLFDTLRAHSHVRPVLWQSQFYEYVKGADSYSQPVPGTHIQHDFTQGRNFMTMAYDIVGGEPIDENKRVMYEDVCTVEKGAKTAGGLYGGTDPDNKNKLVGSTAAWDIVWREGRTLDRACFLVLWDDDLARVPGKKTSRHARGDVKPTITAQTLSAVQQNIFLPHCLVDVYRVEHSRVAYEFVDTATNGAHGEYTRYSCHKQECRPTPRGEFGSKTLCDSQCVRGGVGGEGRGGGRRGR